MKSRHHSPAIGLQSLPDGGKPGEGTCAAAARGGPSVVDGEMAERSNALQWKCRVPRGAPGSESRSLRQLSEFDGVWARGRSRLVLSQDAARRTPVQIQAAPANLLDHLFNPRRKPQRSRVCGRAVDCAGL